MVVHGIWITLHQASGLFAGYASLEIAALLTCLSLGTVLACAMGLAGGDSSEFFTGRTNTAIAGTVIEELITGEVIVLRHLVTLMRYAWRYIVFLKVFVIGRSAVGFVGYGLFNFHARFELVASDPFNQQFVIIDIRRRCNRVGYDPMLVIDETMIFIAQRTLAVFTTNTCIRIDRADALFEFFMILIKLIVKFFCDHAKLRPNVIDVGIG